MGWRRLVRSFKARRQSILAVVHENHCSIKSYASKKHTKDCSYVSCKSTPELIGEISTVSS